jgi:hypothetical protein
MTYVTPDEVKSFAKINYEDLGYSTDAEYEAYINELIVHCESLVESYCNVPRGYFAAGGMSFTEKYDYKEPIYLRHKPLISVSKVEINKAGYGQTPNWEEIASTTYLVNPLEGSVRLLTKFPATELQSVRITYTAGFSSVPQTVTYVVKNICSNFLHTVLQRKISPVIRIDDWTVRLVLNEAFTPELKQLLAPYRRRFAMVG